MKLFWHFHVLFFATHWLLGDGAGGTKTGPCSSAGELPAPEFFLNATSAGEGDRVSARCVTSDPLLTNIFFCKDGRLIFAHETKPPVIDYTLLLNISQLSTGHYSCGYQQKDGNTSRLSAVWKLTVPSEHSGTRFAALVILIPAPLLYFLVKKVVAHYRSSREEASHANRKDSASEDQLKYAEIVGWHKNMPPPSKNPETETVTYVAMASLNKKTGLRFVPASMSSNTTREDTSE